MENIVVILIVIFIFYVVPALLRLRRPKKYEYPRIPGQVLPPEDSPPVLWEKTASAADWPGPAIIKPPVSFAEMPQEASAAPGTSQQHGAEMQLPATVEDASPWEGKLDSAAVLNGVVFAEILRPPRALRKRIRD